MKINKTMKKFIREIKEPLLFTLGVAIVDIIISIIITAIIVSIIGI